MKTPPPAGFSISHRRLPHWRMTSAVYFLTFRLQRSVLARHEIELVRERIKAGHGTFYMLFAAVVMPDHVHALLQPLQGIALEQIAKGLKGSTARELNRERGTRGQLWQAESWDRIVRTDLELAEKCQYMFENPLKKGLCADTWTYPGWAWIDE